MRISEAATRVVPWKKVFLKISQNSVENSCAKSCRPDSCNFIKKETLAQVFSYEFFEIFKNIFCSGTPLVAASRL